MSAEQRIAIVTGAAGGIGRALVGGLLGAGVKVAAADRTAEGLAELAQAAQERQQGANLMTIEADLAQDESIAEIVAQARARFGTIDILVNNAGLQRDSAFADMTLEKWNKVLGVNLTGQFLCARAAIREFLRRGVVPSVSRAAGKIICMSSVHQQIPWAGHANYASSKGGIKLLMESLAQEMAPHRIRVNGIAPGAIRTPINTEAWQTPEAYAALMTLVPYGRIGEPEDIARAAVWLASDQSDYVVGTTLFVDGGMTLYPGFATGG
jgi:glucose 1-dehydrogenase